MNKEATVVALSTAQKKELFKDVNAKGDKIVEYFLAGYFLCTILLAPEYDTWFLGLTVSTLCLLSYFFTKKMLPESDMSRYVAAGSFAIFMALFIYQMHGMFEMHFFAYVGCTMLIAYQNWKLQIPLILIVAVHHALFAYLQYSGMEEIYFTQLEYMDLKTFIIHVILAAIIVGICAYWAYQAEQKTMREGLKSVLLQSRITTNTEIAQKVAGGDFDLGPTPSQPDEVTTALREMATNLARQQQELKSQHEKLSSFTTLIAHDLRTPLRGIRSLTEWISEDLPEEQRGIVDDHISKVLQRVDRMWNQLDSLATFINLDKTNRNKESIDMNMLLNEIIPKHKIDPAPKLVLQDPLPTILGVRHDWELLFFHLISNSVTHGGRTDITIKINSRMEEGNHVFEYHDNGIGIRESQFESLTGIFKTLETKDRVDTPGIGLSIIVKIISLNGGSYSLLNPDAEGFSFQFILPAT